MCALDVLLLIPLARKWPWQGAVGQPSLPHHPQREDFATKPTWLGLSLGGVRQLPSRGDGSQQLGS